MRRGHAVRPARRPRRAGAGAPQREHRPPPHRGPGAAPRARRWRPTSAIARSSSGRTRARRSTRVGPSSSRSSCPTCRTSSRAGSSRSTRSSSTSRRPDAHGFCSLGTSVEAMQAAIQAAGIVIAQVNAAMPRTLGESFVHVDDIDYGGRGRHPALPLPGPGDRGGGAPDRRVRGRPRARRRHAPDGDRGDPERRGALPPRQEGPRDPHRDDDRLRRRPRRGRRRHRDGQGAQPRQDRVLRS